VDGGARGHTADEAELGFRCPAASSGEQQSMATPQAARGQARPPCSHFKIQSCFCLGSAFELVGFQNQLP
jgi:hypothetical protein